MSDVYFVKTRTNYQPYDDLFRLAELSGYPIIFCDKLNAKDFIWVTSEPCKCATCERSKRARK